MIVDAVNSVPSAPAWVRGTSVMAAPSTAAKIVAQAGPPVALGTRDRNW
jgi:hypothetical protein